MSKLTQGLERIQAWLIQKMPDRALQLEPGLSREEIDAKVKHLPFKLPEEVYELYQWHDGSSGYDFLFENYEFMCLQEAVAIYEELLSDMFDNGRQEALFVEYSLPLFQLWYNNGVCYTVVPSEQEDSIICMYDSECQEYSLRYQNLTNLILHLADWYEAAECVEDKWDINEEMRCLLDVKYMAKDYLINSIIRQDAGRASKICREIYQHYINGDISLPNT